MQLAFEALLFTQKDFQRTAKAPEASRLNPLHAEENRLERFVPLVKTAQ